MDPKKSQNTSAEMLRGLKIIHLFMVINPLILFIIMSTFLGGFWKNFEWVPIKNSDVVILILGLLAVGIGMLWKSQKVDRIMNMSDDDTKMKEYKKIYILRYALIEIPLCIGIFLLVFLEHYNLALVLGLIALWIYHILLHPRCKRISKLIGIPIGKLCPDK